MTVIECVPNFSEGRNQVVLDGLKGILGSTPRVKLLGYESGQSVNRSVFTLAGDAEEIVVMLYGAIAASQAIDMRKHTGEHPRLGACDVCPFIPLDDKPESMQVCVEASRKLGKMVGEELSVPVFLYGESASHISRRELAALRKGGYEGLAAKLQDPEYAPDFGPVKFNARSGATVIGARQILVAYNISLNTKSREIAQAIAKEVRESKLNPNSGLKSVKAMGWVIEDENFNCAQVSMNLMDYKTTGMYEAFVKVSAGAEKLGAKVTGSEVVGLVPLEALLNTAKQTGKAYQDVSEKELVSRAIDFLGLNLHYKFDPEAKILDYALKKLPQLRSRP